MKKESKNEEKKYMEGRNNPKSIFLGGGGSRVKKKKKNIRILTWPEITIFICFTVDNTETTENDSHITNNYFVPSKGQNLQKLTLKLITHWQLSRIIELVIIIGKYKRDDDGYITDNNNQKNI